MVALAGHTALKDALWTRYVAYKQAIASLQKCVFYNTKNIEMGGVVVCVVLTLDKA